MAPLEDLLVRKALAHGVDMEKIVRGRLGPYGDPCEGHHIEPDPMPQPDADYLPYDPDYARELLPISTYGSASALPPLKIDLSRPDMVEMGLAMKEYWKDNLGIELDILKRESGTPQREDSQLYRISLGVLDSRPVSFVQSVPSLAP